MAETPVIDNASANYQAVDADAQKAIDNKIAVVKKEANVNSSSTLARWANRLGIPAALAAIGLGGASIANQESPIDTTANVASFTAGVAKDTVSFTAGRLEERGEAFENNWKNGTPDPNDPRNQPQPK